MSNPVINVNNGMIRGAKKTSPFSQKTYYSFFGIPYAEPAVDSFSFKAPRKKKNWSGILKCTREKAKSIQYCIFNHEIQGGADSLHVNVHIPELPTKGDPPKPVIILIHPGGHLFGSALSEDFGSPSVFMHRDIIYVTLNYRLDIYGFLNLNIRECSGNMGLKDIVMAFQWVKDNIHHFNGDPENITALGPSSGASIIHLLLCIPSTEGLFHKAILMGDIIFNNFVQYQDDNVTLAFKFGAAIGYIEDDRLQLLKHIKKYHPALVLHAMRTIHICCRLESAKLYPAALFMPSLEKVGGQRILTESPRKLISSMRSIPIIHGFCEKESIFGFIETRRLATFKTFKQTAFFQNEWGWMKQVKNKEEMVEKILQFYFQDGKEFQEDIERCVDMCTDEVIFDAYDTLVNRNNKKLPTSTYVYRFEHVGKLNEQKIKVAPLLQPPLKGTMHLDDFYHLCNKKTPEQDSKDYKIVEMLTKWFTNFSKTGNPNDPQNEGVYWEPSTPDSPHYLRIKEDPELCRGELLSEEKMQFWGSIKNEFLPEEM